MTSPVASDRAACPACGAATKPGDPWCTLCFADLRPKAVPPPPRPVAPAPRAAVPASPSFAAPAAQAAPSGPAVNPITALSTGVVSTTPLPADAKTPDGIKAMSCPTCGDPMPIVAEVCPSCGHSPFASLKSTTQVSLKLPVVGDLMRFDRGMRYTVTLVFALVVAAILVGIVYGVGAIL
ncbi:MAG TPA: hypothetical protein VHE83_11225 [Mycobacteriales bacterium]|nr:hypothetical protein [Mycobacteriales bacterium]